MLALFGLKIMTNQFADKASEKAPRKNGGRKNNNLKIYFGQPPAQA